MLSTSVLASGPQAIGEHKQRTYALHLLLSTEGVT